MKDCGGIKLKLTYELSKERYEEILEKPLNKKLESLNTINKSKFYRVFLAIAIPLFSLVLLIGILADGIESTVELFPRILSCIVLLFLYFELSLKLMPKILKKILKKKSMFLIENKLSNINESIKVIIEIDKKCIRQYGKLKSEEISYYSIEKVNIFDDFIHIEYLKNNFIDIPLESFNNEDELEQCYEIIKENIKCCKNEKLTIDKADFTYTKTEDDIRNLDKYLYTTKEGELIINVLKDTFSYFAVLGSISGLILITFISGVEFICIAIIIFSILIFFTRTKKAADRLKAITLEQEIKTFNTQNKNRSITFKEDGIQFYQEDNICTIKYEAIKSLEESNGLILLKNDLFLAYIPNRIFSSEGKQKVINILKSKCNIL